MDSTPQPAPPRPAAHVGRRLLSLLYDALPVLALWFATSVPFMLLDVAISGDVRHSIGPWSLLQWLLWAACWIATGLYATTSWQRGGQTLGMRPWRIRVEAVDGGAPTRAALWRRYAVGTLSLLAAGLGFWWAWIDPRRATWHDLAAGTRVVRVPKPG